MPGDKNFGNVSQQKREKKYNTAFGFERSFSRQELVDGTFVLSESERGNYGKRSDEDEFNKQTFFTDVPAEALLDEYTNPSEEVKNDREGRQKILENVLHRFSVGDLTYWEYHPAIDDDNHDSVVFRLHQQHGQENLELEIVFSPGSRISAPESATLKLDGKERFKYQQKQATEHKDQIDEIMANITANALSQFVERILKHIPTDSLKSSS